MSVSILANPPALSFSADLISAKFACTGYLSQVGVRAVNQIAGIDTFTVGTVLTIKYGSNTVVMTAATTPDDSGNQFQAYDPLIVGYSEMVAKGFRANYQLSKDFDIVADGTNTIFNARLFGPTFNFTTVGAPTTLGQAEIKQPNYTVLFKLFLENEDNTAYDLIYTANLQLLPGTNGEAEAMIGDKLHTIISLAIRKNLPEQPTTSVMQCKRSCRRYYFEFAESYGEPIAVKKLQTSEIFTVLHGGLSSIAQSQYSISDLLALSMEDNDRFLTQFGSFVNTRTNQPQYLYFYNTRVTKNVRLVNVFTFTDSTTHTIEIPAFEILQGRKYAFNTRFDFLYSDPVPDKIVASYSVALFDGASRVSELTTYVLDYTFRNFVRYFLNWSSWGALDSRAFYGKGESSFELANKTADRIRSIGENIQFGSSFVFDSTINRLFKVATGWQTRAQISLNTDFFLSNLKYRYNKGSALPIAVANGKVSEITDGENLMAQVMEYRYLFADHAYTEGDEEETCITYPNFNISSGFVSIPAKATGFGVWKNVTSRSALITLEAMPLRFKSDCVGFSNQVVTFLQGQFNLLAFSSTSINLGRLDADSRPPVKISQYFITDNVEMYLNVDVDGYIYIVSKDGVNLPNGTIVSKTYFINLNFKPLTL